MVDNATYGQKSLAWRNGYNSGVADERTAWENLGLGEARKHAEALKDHQAKFDASQVMLEANRNEVSRLNGVIKQLVAERDDLKVKLSAAGKARHPDERTDRVVQAIRDLNDNADASAQAIKTAVEQISDDLGRIEERLVVAINNAALAVGNQQQRQQQGARLGAALPLDFRRPRV